MPSQPTNVAFIAAIQAMTVNGVARHYDEPPASIDLSDSLFVKKAYCAFPTMPSANQGDLVSTCINMSKSRSIGYVVIVEAAGQGTQAQNYTKLASLMDNLETALDGLTIANFIDYEITTTGNYPLGDSEYWAIVANITVRET